MGAGACITLNVMIAQHCVMKRLRKNCSVCACVLLCVCVRACVRACVRVCVHACMFVCVWVWVSAFMCVLCVSACVFCEFMSAYVLCKCVCVV